MKVNDIKREGQTFKKKLSKKYVLESVRMEFSKALLFFQEKQWYMLALKHGYLT